MTKIGIGTLVREPVGIYYLDEDDDYRYYMYDDLYIPVRAKVNNFSFLRTVSNESEVTKRNVDSFPSLSFVQFVNIRRL